MADGKHQNGGERADFADYTAAMTADLAALARRHGLQTLAYLLDMARLEAENVTGHTKARETS